MKKIRDFISNYGLSGPSGLGSLFASMVKGPADKKAVDTRGQGASPPGQNGRGCRALNGIDVLVNNAGSRPDEAKPTHSQLAQETLGGIVFDCERPCRCRA